MRIKVGVHTLIEAVEAAKADAEVEYEAALCAYNDAQPEYRQAVIDVLKAAWCEAKRGALPEPHTSRWNGGRYVDALYVELDKKIEAPTEPREPDLSRYDRDLALLRACADETLSISTDDDFARYL